MGTFGLWKYVSNHHVQYCADKPVATSSSSSSGTSSGVDHLCLDMNGIMHQCYSKEHPTTAATMKNVLALLQKLLSMFPPKKSLVIAFDGSAPTAKLRTQRERRQSMMKNPQKQELNEAQIVTGSTFVFDCEVEVTKFVRTAIANGKFGDTPIDADLLTRVVISGSRTPGEGEIKIAEELKRIAEDSMRLRTYAPDDRIVIVGNDSDLVLVCVACVQYHNFYLINPHSFVATYVGELFAHWSNAVPNGQLHLDLLPSFRLDFVLIMLLAGGDHYSGVEDDCLYMWRKYRKLRSDGGFFRSSIVRGDEINWELLRAVVAKDHGSMQHYVGSKNKRKSVKVAGNTCPADPGFQLLKGARWSLRMLRGDGCANYHMRCGSGEKSCSIGNLRSALQSGSGLQANSKVVVNHEPPLLPLQVYCAVLGSAKFLPAAVSQALETKGTAARFVETFSPSTMVTVIKEAFEIVDTTKVNGKEKQLMSFAAPCFLIGSDPSSAEAADGSAVQPAPLPFEYPEHVSEIRLLNLYDHRYSKISRSKGKPTAVHASKPPPQEAQSCDEPGVITESCDAEASERAVDAMVASASDGSSESSDSACGD